MTAERTATAGGTVTVIVPGHDIARYAPEALQSLRDQTFLDWRAVLVHDGGPDDPTRQIFADAAAADPRFHFVTHGQQRSLSAARNTGLDLVRTPYLGFLDADDRMRPHALERMVEMLDASGSDFVAGAYVRLRPDPAGRYAAGDVQPWVSAATDPARTATTLAAHPAASGNIVAWSKLSRTDFWQRHGLRFPEGRLYEDQVIAQRMYTQARAFDVIPDVVVEWRERADGSSITQQRSALPVVQEYLAALRGGIQVLRDAGAEEAVRARIALIRTLDVPPLREIAVTHPDPAYGEAVEAFLAELPPPA
ncbi:glycosyltransferase family 2 protein [Microbacterium sp. RD1]|uniref:glycosyltransferase family 2 protein n=1 Tax=Microbacterium sp. RD1 TaxID=3457313 RepID=UPI003FA60AC9